MDRRNTILVVHRKINTGESKKYNSDGHRNTILMDRRNTILVDQRNTILVGPEIKCGWTTEIQRGHKK